MREIHRVQVLLQSGDAERFERFCQLRGHKKSTLIARLIRDHLDREDLAGCAPSFLWKAGQ